MTVQGCIAPTTLPSKKGVFLFSLVSKVFRFAVLRRDYVNAECNCLLRGAPVEPYHWKARTEPLLRQCRRAAPWALETVVMAQSLPRALAAEFARQRYLALERRALCLVTGAQEMVPNVERQLRRAVFGFSYPQVPAAASQEVLTNTPASEGDLPAKSTRGRASSAAVVPGSVAQRRCRSITVTNVGVFV